MRIILQNSALALFSLSACSGLISPLPGALGADANKNGNPANFFFAQKTYSFEVNQSISPLVPSFENDSPEVSFSVTPNLPTGLLLDAQHGKISGTPTRLSSAQTYRVELKDGTTLLPFDVSLSVEFFGTLQAAQIFPAGNPGPAYQGRLVYDSQRKSVILYGGSTAANSVNPVNGMWELKNGTWTALCNGNCVPGARARHGLVYDETRDRILLIGGVTDSGGSTASDMWQWKDGVWTRLKINGQNLVLPSELSVGFAAVYDKKRDRVVTFGGRGASGRSPYVYEFDGATWGAALRPLPRPTARSENALQTMVYDEHRGTTVLYGGEGTNGTTNDDTWTWDGTAWTNVCNACTGHARRLASLVYDSARDTTVLFDGWDNNSEISETWEMKDNVWTQINDTSAVVPGRDGLISAYNADTQSTIIYSGDGSSCSGGCNQTYEYRLPR